MRFVVPKLFLGSVLLAGSVCQQAIAAPVPTAVNQEIETLLRIEDLEIRGAKILTQAILQEIYQGHEFKPFWTRPERIRELVTLISDSADHGLTPADYNLDQLKSTLQLLEAFPANEIQAETDIMLTESLLRYGYHRRFGKVKASSLDPDINLRR